ncbi:MULTISPECIES: nucleotidyltransferase family protein [Rhizobium/Agrobacterium group]|uniref:Uncharacterized protein n=2 Tax=Rhizobium/Agrobacterium group TaxID=227290 RepID=B9JQN6_RHIR8|nr:MULTISPECIES: nucleotidyltransferase family protein [Agrobacterium tumefaciens complex]ACM31479.1 hypothetical protein Arad_15025 [Rhizobium rhizogenes K84]UXS56410.1 nucleotidyltransferase family protein [Agrobacterium tumefaciens]UXS66754.1 nucleotidyltransferase family protein [Agrobacterium tumefaciens]UXT85494.1 nucleotidyltransferase family protein [Agrobacterium tumefaciens]
MHFDAIASIQKMSCNTASILLAILCGKQSLAEISALSAEEFAQLFAAIRIHRVAGLVQQLIKAQQDNSTFQQKNTHLDSFLTAIEVDVNQIDERRQAHINALEYLMACTPQISQKIMPLKGLASHFILPARQFRRWQRDIDILVADEDVVSDVISTTPHRLKGPPAQWEVLNAEIDGAAFDFHRYVHIPTMKFSSSAVPGDIHRISFADLAEKATVVRLKNDLDILLPSEIDHVIILALNVYKDFVNVASVNQIPSASVRLYEIIEIYTIMSSPNFGIEALSARLDYFQCRPEVEFILTLVKLLLGDDRHPRRSSLHTSLEISPQARRIGNAFVLQPTSSTITMRDMLGYLIPRERFKFAIHALDRMAKKAPDWKCTEQLWIYADEEVRRFLHIEAVFDQLHIEYEPALARALIVNIHIFSHDLYRRIQLSFITDGNVVSTVRGDDIPIGNAIDQEGGKITISSATSALENFFLVFDIS